MEACQLVRKAEEVVSEVEAKNSVSERALSHIDIGNTQAAA